MKNQMKNQKCLACGVPLTKSEPLGCKPHIVRVLGPEGYMDVTSTGHTFALAVIPSSVFK